MRLFDDVCGVLSASAQLFKHFLFGSLSLSLSVHGLRSGRDVPNSPNPKKDVVTSLRDKLCLSADEHFSLVLEHVKSLKRNKLTLLDPEETLARVSSN